MRNNTVKYPIGIQSFPRIRKEGYVYIDKTALIYKLVSTGSYYFLSRPRRFGKSLLMSTLEAYFEGRKELFEGLAIAGLEEKWEQYPVIMLSLAGYRGSDNNLEALLDNRWAELEEKYGRLGDTQDLSERFRNIIRAAFEKTGKQVVVLIDEYDAPIVDHLGEDEDKVEQIRDFLKSVYVHLKDMDGYLRFVMLTGVSRFSKMTIFSGINHLRDISLLPEWSEICGITEKELKENFQEGIKALADAQESDYDGALQLLKEHYDGYRFTARSVDIYNPYNLMNALADSDCSAYWFRTATPTFLIKQLRKDNRRWTEILSQRVSESALTEIETYRTSPVSLLFQAGYLTIKDYDRRRRQYLLKIPNKEVETGLFTELLAYNKDIEKSEVDNQLWDIRDSLEEGNPDRALDIIRSFFAGIPGNVTAKHPEIFYENNLYMLFRLIGIDARAEWWTSDGRIDMLLQFPDFVYVMELKLDKSAEEAMAQIDAKDYALPWKYDGRQIIKIGINFSTSSRNIDSWLIEIVEG